MGNYDDITQTLLINKIKIKYDANREGNKYLRYSWGDPHSFIYPDISSRINHCKIYRKCALLCLSHIVLSHSPKNTNRKYRT
ncbi:hypothetical protein PFDG_05208 [Plasmodium falciparum Dd2]|uniref:Uncharacterized protein n=1 Tax=Plasmodium falciparum (isolate Dd2) TaxID=57267 RepID=A0A0L7MA28_PLAF4|nr:hypothetical protein PFDG_05208 [Plasmodium falciparum Dd2]